MVPGSCEASNVSLSCRLESASCRLPSSAFINEILAQMQVACVARHSIELDQCKLYLLMPAVAAFLSSFSPKDRINRVGITADDIQQFRFAGCLEVRHSCLDHMPCTVEFVPMPEIRPSLVWLDNGIVRIEVAIRLLCRSDQRNHLIEKAIKR